jgi:hypothetical protein
MPKTMEEQLADMRAKLDEANKTVQTLVSRARLNVKIVSENAKGEPYKAGPLASFSDVPGAVRGNVALRGETYLWLVANQEEIGAILREEGLLES